MLMTEEEMLAYQKYLDARYTLWDFEPGTLEYWLIELAHLGGRP